jgi:hypothetical protein
MGISRDCKFYGIIEIMAIQTNECAFFAAM